MGTCTDFQMQKSRDKNVIIEDTRRRNEASMKRKLAATVSVTSEVANGSQSPVPTGAMDTLLEKLRAAAPQARDQRDRRRRARLKDKHQNRVASGQNIPDIAAVRKASLTSPTLLPGGDGEGSNETDGEGDSEDASSTKDANKDATKDGTNKPSSVAKAASALSPTSDEAEADVADRAASMLHGLRSDQNAGSDGGGGAAAGPLPSIRLQRRRENADDERARRRRRRAAASAAAAASAEAPPRASNGLLYAEAFAVEANGEVADPAEQTEPEPTPKATPKATPNALSAPHLSLPSPAPSDGPEPS